MFNLRIVAIIIFFEFYLCNLLTKTYFTSFDIYYNNIINKFRCTISYMYGKVPIVSFGVTVYLECYSNY